MKGNNLLMIFKEKIYKPQEKVWNFFKKYLPKVPLDVIDINTAPEGENKVYFCGPRKRFVVYICRME